MTEVMLSKMPANLVPRNNKASVLKIFMNDLTLWSSMIAILDEVKLYRVYGCNRISNDSLEKRDEDYMLESAHTNRGEVVAQTDGMRDTSVTCWS